MLAAVSGVRGRNLAVLAPRGKTGMATGEFKDMIAWPTSHQAQQEHLQGILASFAADQRALERLNGAAFEKLYVVGFSNGAYFATSIVIHGRLRADGAAVFAGGSGKWINPRAARTRPRLFVGWGEDDKTKDDPIGLSEVLADAGWPHEAQGYEGVGHAMTMAQMKDAFDYLTGP
jgi:predicted esterase